MKVKGIVVPVHIGEAEVQLHPFLFSAPDGELSTSRPNRLTPRQKPGTLWIGGCEGPVASLDGFGGKKISCPCRNLNPGPSSRERKKVQKEGEASVLSDVTKNVNKYGMYSTRTLLMRGPNVSNDTDHTDWVLFVISSLPPDRRPDNSTLSVTTLPVHIFEIQYSLSPNNLTLHSLSHHLWRHVIPGAESFPSASQEISRIYGTRRFITAFTSARHLSLSWARSIQSMSPHPTAWRSILILSSHLRLGLPSCLFPSGFPTKTLYAPLISPYVLHAPLVSLSFISSPD